MADLIRRARAAALIAAAFSLLAIPASATFLGLDVGDKIDTMGLTISPGNGSFNDAADTIDAVGFMDNITTTGDSPGGPNTTVEIGGGTFNVRLDLESEELVNDGFGLFTYTAIFSGRTGGTDIEIFAPTGGPNPEQDGRLLISGEFDTNMDITLVVQVAPGFGFAGTPSFAGTFDVTGGDATFMSAFGTTGDLANLFLSATDSTPSSIALTADGWLLSVRDTDLGACQAQAIGTTCAGNVVDQSGSHVFSSTGEVQPLNASPFVPEPGTGLLVGFGLIGLAARKHSRA